MAFSAVTERGSAAASSSGTTLAVSPSANLTVGKIVYAFCSTDNTSITDGATTDHTSVTDTHGHTWTKVYEQTNSLLSAAADGVTGSLWWTKVTTQIGTGNSITLTIGTARVVRVISMWEVTVGAGNTIQLATGGSTFLLSTSNNPGALTLAGLASKEYLFLGLCSNEDNTLTWTEDADYTNVFAAEGVGTTGGGAATNITHQAGYRIATLTGDTFDIAGVASTEHVLALLAFEEVTGAVTLTGSLFTKAPTFFTGTITPGAVALTGTLFTKAPTFPTGVLTARYNLTGALFVKAPTFNVGAITAIRALTGVLFTKAPTFPTGVLTAQYSLTGSLFTKAPTFFTGTVSTGAYALTGTLFVKAPTFPTGVVTAGAVNLTGVLFQKAPTFPTGTVTTVYSLTGTLYVNTPTFPAGTIGQTGTLFGTLFVKAPTFFTGTLAQGGPSFWQPNPAGWTANPSAFVRVGRYGPSPWGAELSGRRFEKAPTFPVGTVT